MSSGIQATMANTRVKIDAQEQGERLRKARIQRGFQSARSACEFFGWNYNTYTQHENGTGALSPRNAPRYAEAYGVSAAWLLTGEGAGEQVPMLPVSGKVSAGVWVEVDIDFNEHRDSAEMVPADPSYPKDAQFVLEVDGNSINRVAVSGDRLVCVSTKHRRSPRLSDRDLVIVRRTRFGGQLMEFTAKRLRIPQEQDAVWELWPDSTDEAHQGRLLLENVDEFDTVEIIGKVSWILRKP